MSMATVFSGPCRRRFVHPSAGARAGACPTSADTPNRQRQRCSGSLRQQDAPLQAGTCPIVRMEILVELRPGHAHCISQWRRRLNCLRRRGTLLRGYTSGPEFVLHGHDRGLPAVTSHDSAPDQQLHRSHVVQQNRPHNGELHIQPDRHRPPRVEQDTAARKVDRTAISRILKLPPPDQLPAQVQHDSVTAVRTTLTADRLNTFRLLGPLHEVYYGRGYGPN